MWATKYAAQLRTGKTLIATRTNRHWAEAYAGAASKRTTDFSSEGTASERSTDFSSDPGPQPTAQPRQNRAKKLARQKEVYQQDKNVRVVAGFLAGTGDNSKVHVHAVLVTRRVDILFCDPIVC